MKIDQALFGYDRGHRLISSSRKLGKEATWVLRNVTDMKVSKRNGHYLTVLPVPDVEAHAFARTWSAGGSFRPGSVWSHVLFVALADLGDVEDFGVLTSLFSRPSIEEPASLPDLKRAYAKPLTLPVSGLEARLRQIDRTSAERIILAAYREDTVSSAEVLVEDAREVEPTVLGLMSQRPAGLRREFSARTRFRPSQTTAAHFDLEIVERSSATSEAPSSARIPSWVSALRADLERPNTALRLFLREHTAPGDRSDVIPKLVDVFTSVGESVEAGIRAVVKCFPRRTERVELKRDLFGPRPTLDLTGPGWPTSDPERLKVLLSVPHRAVALSDYEVSARLADWAKEDPVAAAVAVVSTDLDGRSASDLDELADGVANGFDTDWVGRLIGTLLPLGPRLLVRRPDVWSSPEVWTTELDHALLVDLVTRADATVQRATYLRLLANGLSGAAGELLQAEPGLWWSIVDPEQADYAAQERLVIAGSRRLAMASAASRGACPWRLTTMSQAMVIASVTDPDEGIWREVDAGLWIRSYESGLEPVSDDRYQSIRRDVMALGAAFATDEPSQRRALWSLVFARLHRALMGSGTPMGCERTLANLLPDGPSWDWCGRLRYGLARAAVADGWTDVELRRIARGAGEFSADVLAAADSMRHPHSRSLVEEVVGFVTGWWR